MYGFTGSGSDSVADADLTGQLLTQLTTRPTSGGPDYQVDVTDFVKQFLTSGASFIGFRFVAASPSTYESFGLADGSGVFLEFQEKSDITPTAIAFDATGGVDYGYTISNADLPQATTVDLYWASGTTTDTEIGSPISSTTTQTSQGTYPLQAPASDLTARPQGAKYLLAVADPDNLISPADPSKVASLPLQNSDIIPGSMDWNYTVGGVDLAYQVVGADLSQQASVNFYWSNQNTPVFQPGETSVFTPAAPQKSTFQSQGPHTLHLDPSGLTTPLPGSYYLIAVFNYPPAVNLISGSHTAAVALRPALLAPTVTISVSPNAPQKGLLYAVTVNVTNNAPLKLDYKIDWREIYQQPSDLRDAATENTTGPGTDGYDIGGVGFKETRALPSIPYVTTWDWIDKTNPITGSSDKAINDFQLKVLKDTLSEILKDLSTNASTAVSFINNLIKASHVIDGTRSASLVFDARVESTVTYAPPSPGFSPSNELAIQLSVPDKLTKSYEAYLLLKASSEASLTFAAAALKKPTPANDAAATALLTAAVAFRVQASQYYDQAVDPPDPNYKTVVTPFVPDVPEVDQLPQGAPKQLAQAELEAESFVEAAAVSQNRAAGAAQAGDAVWESRQYAAAADDFASAAALEPRISALLAAVEDSLAGLPTLSPADVLSYLSANGLPQPMGDLFSRLGLSPSQISNVFQDLTQSGPDQFTDPQLAPGMVEVASILTASLGHDNLEKAIAIDTGPLGMTATALSGTDQQALDTDQEAVRAALTSHSPPSKISDLMTKFALDVDRAALSTNNPAALQASLDFSENSILQAQQAVTDLQPSLDPIADQTVNLGTPASFQANGTVGHGSLSLTYSLDPGYPAGAKIDPSTGAFKWNPSAPGNYSITVRATENGSPPLSDAQTFTITVTIPPPTVPRASGFGAGRDAFVTTLYHDDLNRLPEPQGLKFWSRTLARGVKPVTVAQAIWRSREHRALQSRHLAPSMSFRRSFSDAMKAGFQAAHPRRSHAANSISRALRS